MTREKIINDMVISINIKRDISKIELEIKHSSNNFNFQVDISDMFNFDKDRTKMSLIKSYFELKGFLVEVNYHSNERCQNFTIGW